MVSFGLTPREAEPTELLARDITLTHAADTLDISRKNARAHLKQVFPRPTPVGRLSSLVLFAGSRYRTRAAKEKPVRMPNLEPHSASSVSRRRLAQFVVKRPHLTGDAVQHVRDLFDGLRLTEEKALDLRTAFRPQSA
jgi:hypothetical protein